MKVIKVLTEDMARSRRYRSQISTLSRQLEVTYADSARIAEGIGEMSDWLPEAAFEEDLTLNNLTSRGHWVASCQNGVRDAVRTYADIRLARQFPNIVPAKAEIPNQPAHVNARKRYERGCCGLQVDRSSGPESPMNKLEGNLFFISRTSR